METNKQTNIHPQVPLIKTRSLSQGILIKTLTFCKVALGQIMSAESSETGDAVESDSAHARALGKDIHLPAVRRAGNSGMFLMCLSFPYPRAICSAWGLWEGQEKVVWLHTGRMQRAPGRAAHAPLCALQVLCLPVCLLLLAQTRSCTTSQSPAHVFTGAQGQGCWLGQREVKHSSQVLGYSFAPWEFVEPQVDAEPAGLQVSSGAQGLTQQDASTF